MTNDALPRGKKRYEPPSITSPESDSGRGSNFHPSGLTGCGFGSHGATCVDGTDPQGTPASCNAGSSPTIRDCNAGFNAGNDCVSGTDAFTGCNTGTRVQGDCADGSSPLGADCATGTLASTCNSGGSGGS